MNVRIIAFALYFAALFGIGLYSLKRTQSEADYWIAGGQLRWLVGGATIAATHVSAGTFIGTIGVIYTVGWSFTWLVLSIPLAYWFLAAVLAPRFTRVRQLTLPAFMERRYYSKRVRGLAAAIILLATVVYVQAQIVAGGLIANTIFGVPTVWGMVGFTAFLLAYTVVGGMVAVVYTDFLQLLVMTVGVLFAVPLAIRQVGGGEALFTLVERANPLTFSWAGLPPALLFTMGLSFLLGSVATPERLVRLFAMRDMHEIRRGILFAILMSTGINLLVFILALASIVLFPLLPTGDLAMPMMASAVLPPVLGTILLAAILSAMMSTVDSLLIVAGSALSVDLYQNLWAPDADVRRRRMVDRIGILLVGSTPLVLILLGVGEGELVQFIVLLFTALMAASFFAPVVGGVLWKRATREGATAAMVGGVTTTLGWEAWGPTGIDPVLPGFVVSVLALIVVSLLTPAPPAEALSMYFEAE